MFTTTTLSTIISGLKVGNSYRVRLASRTASCLVQVDDATNGVPFFREMDPKTLGAFGPTLVLTPSRFAEAVLAAW